MLIDRFEQCFLDDLYERASQLQRKYNLYLLVDGAFVRGIHKSFKVEEKRILFEALPSCNDETRNVSPFLIRFDPFDQRQRILLSRACGWPMISLIETPEELSDLFTRLSAWCVVEVENDRFNFRFADTRRLPAIAKYLTAEQCRHFFGPAQRWSFVNREGDWADLDIVETRHKYHAQYFYPILQKSQFAALLDDSRPDEILAVMAYRGEETGVTCYQRWVLVIEAIKVADASDLRDSDLIEWAIWYVKNSHLCDDSVVSILETWRKENGMLSREIN